MLYRTRHIIPLLLLIFLSACNMVIVRQGNEEDEPTPKNDSVVPQTPDQKRDLNYLFDLEQIPKIELAITEKDWNQFLENFDNNADNRQYIPAHFVFIKGNDRWERDSVGLRLRGNTSRHRPEGDVGQLHSVNNADWHHAHFGVKFTEYETGERFFGADRIVLKYFNQDPAYCREVFCYNLFHRFEVWTAPRVSYCRLYVHILSDNKVAYFGVYEMIEGVRHGFLDDRRKEGFLADSDGNLWKGAYNRCGPADLSDFSNTHFQKMGITNDTQDYSYSLKTNKALLSSAQQELYNFMEQMRPLPSGSEELKQYLEQNMDVDLFLRAMAVNVAVGMWDDYWVNANNYYFYFDSNHRFYFIPYDYDNTLGTIKHINNNSNAATQNPLNWGSRNGDRLLVKKVLSIAEYQSTYINYLKEIVSSADLMQPDAAISRVKYLQSLIENDITNDTGEDMIMADRPAEWSTKQYLLLSGDKSTNYFKAKQQSIIN